MQKAQEARLNSLRRIQTFLDANASALGTVSKSTSRTDLDAAVTKLEADTSRQAQAGVDATSRTKIKDVAREDLRVNHMQPIAAIARKKLNTVPAIQDLKLPPKNTSDAALLARGPAMADAAAPYTQVFIDQQLPADFIAELRASVEAVKQAVAARETAQLALNAATKAVKDQLAITHTDVKVLNALVVKQLKGRTDLLNAWKSAKRVKAKPGVPTGSTKPPATTPAPTAPAPAPPATPPAATPPAATPASTAGTVPKAA
jgi:hypothetical protein